MGKVFHEIRDPIHIFVKLDSVERSVLDSPSVQRLRHINQLAMTHLIYPGATHKRFEHSLGVMEVASRIFDSIIARNDINEVVPQKDELVYWRRVLRMAALCHDIGHLPFSHAAEKDLLPPGVDHETITCGLIAEEMESYWAEMRPPLRVEDIQKLAVGPKKWTGKPFTPWEAILAEIITGDAFGADRIDYLLRDSLHAGVQYGRFDHYRLIDTLCILPSADIGSGDKQCESPPMLGIEEGGLHTAEAMILARHFMFTQLYCHPVRRIYDIHLKDFLQACLPERQYSDDPREHLKITDAEVTAWIRKSANSETESGHDDAVRIEKRRHFKLIYDPIPSEIEINADASKLVASALADKFGEAAIRRDKYAKSPGALIFPVKRKNGDIESSVNMSREILARIPSIGIRFVFVDPKLASEAKRYLKDTIQNIIVPPGISEENDNGQA